MRMKSPMHPGEFIRSVYIDPLELSATQLAEAMEVSPSTLNRVLNKKSAVSIELALRLSKALGRSAESWLTMQHNYDLVQKRRSLRLSSVKTLYRAKLKRES